LEGLILLLVLDEEVSLEGVIDDLLTLLLAVETRVDMLKGVTVGRFEFAHILEADVGHLSRMHDLFDLLLLLLDNE